MSAVQRLDRGDIAYITFPADMPEDADPRAVRTIRIEALSRCELDLDAHAAVGFAIVRPPKKLTRNRFGR